MLHFVPITACWDRLFLGMDVAFALSTDTRVPIKSSLVSFNLFLMRFPRMKKVSQQNSKLR